MPMIRETIVTSIDRDGHPHIAPFGLTQDGAFWVIAPFKPSATLDNLRAVPFAVANHVDDVRVFAGCLTGRRDWPLLSIDGVPPPRLAGALAHDELEVVQVEEDPQRPRFRCRVLRSVMHAPFAGHNRAQAAVIEGAVLVSRLFMLPRDKVEREIAYLRIAVEKTAGPREWEAWGWLMERVAGHYGAAASSATATAGAHADAHSAGASASASSSAKSW